MEEINISREKSKEEESASLEIDQSRTLSNFDPLLGVAISSSQAPANLNTSSRLTGT